MSLAQKHYQILNTAIDDGLIESEEDTMRILHENQAMKEAVLLDDGSDDFILKFNDNSTLKLDFFSSKDFFDLELSYGYWIPSTVH